MAGNTSSQGVWKTLFTLDAAIPRVSATIPTMSTLSWLNDLLQLVKYDLDAHIAADQAYYEQLREARKPGKGKQVPKSHYSYVRTNAKPPVTELLHPFEQTLAVAWNADLQRARIELDSETLHLGTPVFVDDHKGWIMACNPEGVEIQFETPPPTLNDFAVVKQTRKLIDPQEIVHQLNHFWLPIWQSDEQPTDDMILEFEQLLDTLPFHVQQFDVSMDLPKCGKVPSSV